MRTSFPLSLVLLLCQALFAQAPVRLEEIATGLNAPVAITSAPGMRDTLFVVEQRGVILVVRDERVVEKRFMDISPRVACCGESGLLSVAFHPRFPFNGMFFVNYTNRSGHTTISRFRVSATNSFVGDPDSEEILLVIDQPYGNHNGGQIQFGPDGYLYIGMGDGGAANDPENRAQNPQDLLGKLLRIDIDGGPPYAIPPTNPFVGSATTRSEIWASGLRNPWRFSFDRETGDLFIGDVGQGRFEEINFQPATSRGGENYGWRLMEGRHCNLPPDGCTSGGLTPPILEYAHDTPELHCSVTGGYVYRGSSQALRGTYFYGDYCSGFLWGARAVDGTWRTVIELETGLLISAFGEDSTGELFIADYRGGIYRIVNGTSRRTRPVRR